MPRPERCVVSPGDPAADRGEILRLAGHLPGSPGAERFAKYYDRSPHGPPAVFLAHDISLDRKVAIKVMAPGLLLGEGNVERFRHEAITIAQLQHPNIVSVYAVRQAEGLHFFVMRYVEGRSLEQVIDDSQVIVIGKNDREYRSLKPKLNNGRIVIDLVRLFDARPEENGNYRGICW